mgnify:FL=1
MGESTSLVYAVVITYDGLRFLDGCLSTLQGTRYDNLRILLVINGSSDGSEEFVTSSFPNVEVVSLSENIGCLPACNLGVERAIERGAEYVVLCNDDIEVLDDRWLAATIEAMEKDESIALAGFDEQTTREVTVPGQIDFTEVDDLVGFALVIRAQALKLLGMFDEQFPVFAAEDDLLARAQRAGYRSVQSNVPFLHFGGGTIGRLTPDISLQQMCCALRMCIKHRGPLRTIARWLRIAEIACNPWAFSFNPADDGHVRMRGKGNPLLGAWLWVRATIWNLTHLRETLRARRRDNWRIHDAQEALARPQPPQAAAVQPEERIQTSQPLAATVGSSAAALKR